MNIEPNKAPSTREVLRKMELDDEKEGLLVTPPIKPEGTFGVRHVLAFMGFLGFANVYAMRVNLSVAVVAMVNSSAIPHVNESEADACPENYVNASAPSMQDGEFIWDEKEQALILGSFFYGYVVTNPIGGRLGELIGGKVVFGCGVLVTAVLTLLTPVVARTSTALLIALRIVEGLGEGVTFPAMNSLMARWVPPLERSRTSSLVYAGSQFGTVISMPICGLLCQSTFLGGWPAVFYVFGTLGLVWFVAWMLLIHTDPAKHPRIKLDELTYIEQSLHQDPGSKAPPFPFKSVFTSIPFLAVIVAHFCQNWGFYTLLTEMPTYMKNILHFNIAANSFMSALPYLVMWLFSLAMGRLADYLLESGTLSTTNTRKVFNSIGIYGPMICIVLVGYAGCNRTLAVVLLCCALGFNGATFSGYINSHLDMAPNFAGTLMGITNCVATTPGFLAPLVVSALVKGKETVEQWKLVFWISAIVYFVGNTIYVIFVSGEEQPWNRPQGSSGSGSRRTQTLHQQHQQQQIPRSYRTFDAPGESSGSTGAESVQEAAPIPVKVPEIF